MCRINCSGGCPECASDDHTLGCISKYKSGKAEICTCVIEELKKCPWCDQLPNGYLAQPNFRGASIIQRACTCGAKGPVGASFLYADQLWNSCGVNTDVTREVPS